MTAIPRRILAAIAAMPRPRPIEGPIKFRPSNTVHPVGSHRPRVEVERRQSEPAPLWLRELRRDRREFIV